ncbi:hypothetical protein BDZ97DRAFT_1919458 [Flammula alnicola]|nr:hypothetical protein BDZ97DRAFT_1919458 [Flammula alnicola]
MVNGKTADGYEPYSYDDPSANLWSTYLSKSEKYDKTMAQNWKGDMDAILIFAGLFSASVTSFIVESYKTLNPDPNNASVMLLAQISQQLASISNSSLTHTSPLPVNPFNQFNQGNFSPSTSSLICNALWFLSLGFSLTCALSATLVEQWTRQYLQASTNRPAPQDRARMGAYLYQGIKQYKMAAIVETIPMLLHISLFLFFAGLVAFLIPVNSGLDTSCSQCLFYVAFYTSSRCWALCRKLRLLHRRDADGNEVPIPSRMLKARELDAIEITAERDQRDLKAMCWTINALREDNEFEPFVEVIPNVVSGFDYSAKWLMDSLLNHDDISIKLGYRIPRLLATCTTGLLDPAVAHKRAITCLKSIWSLTMLSIPKPQATSDPQNSASFRKTLRFKEDTFDLLASVQKSIPSIEDHALSASIVIARSLLDMHVDRAIALEEELLTTVETGQRPRPSTHEDGFYIPLSDKEKLLDASRFRIQITAAEISKNKELLKPLPYVMIEALAFHQTRIVSLATNSTHGLDNGLNLTLEYIEKILQSDTLPHEAFNTLRRTFFRINFNMNFNMETIANGRMVVNYDSNMSFTKESQGRLVAYLEEAVEPTSSWTTRLPQSIIDILLSLTQALTDPTLILKAIGIIETT